MMESDDVTDGFRTFADAHHYVSYTRWQADCGVKSRVTLLKLRRSEAERWIPSVRAAWEVRTGENHTLSRGMIRQHSYTLIGIFSQCVAALKTAISAMEATPARAKNSAPSSAHKDDQAVLALR